MITQIKEGYDFIHIAVAVVDNDGKAVDPSAAEAWFYKVSQLDGSISLDTNINGNGKVTLAKQGGQTGFYGSAVATDSLSANEYVILYKVTIESIESITVEFFSIDIAKKLIPFIKTESDKIQPEILDKKGEFKADISGLAPAAEYDTKLAAIQAETDKISSLKTIIELIENVEVGEWKIEADVLYFLDPTGQIMLASFQLRYDDDGNVIRRERIS